MARILIVGCGCRGRELAGALSTAGHAVRGTTRHEASLAGIEATGAEASLADPDRLSTVLPLLDGVTALCWLMGTATGDDEQVAALHGPRLEMMLSKIVDTTVRGVLYEAAGTIAPEAFATGIAELERMGQLNEIPHVVVVADPADRGRWVIAARHAIGELVGVGYDQTR